MPTPENDTHLSRVRRLPGLAFDNSYARLPQAFYEVIEPTPLPDPYLVAWNPGAAALLDLDPDEGRNPDLPLHLAGAKRLPGSEPIAQVYAGHQFGVWVPRLGDGRAFLLGEIRNSLGESWDLHLKGGGQTRFSRGGDGRSVLRSAIREYLAGEALHALGIPTTRALAIAGSDFPIQRETVETAATLLRLSPSHVRFGTFQYFAARGETNRVRELADYVMRRHLPAVGERDRPHAALFHEIATRTGGLVARWMAAGFCHGVLNTDNMSVLGLTLDFGPYGFLDEFDAGHICNHSDPEGRYAWDRQPAVGLWNLARLGEALLPLIEIEEAQEALERYRSEFAETYGGLMRARLGLAEVREEDTALVRDLLGVMQASRADYTRTLRALERDVTFLAELGDSDAARSWLERYRARLGLEGVSEASRSASIRSANPVYVLRNWMAEEAIELARAKDFSRIEELRRLLADPFTEQAGAERYAAVPPGWARDVAVSCSS